MGGSRTAAFALAALLVAGPASATTVIPDPLGDSTDVVDILSVSAGYSATTLVLGGSFAPGTFDPTTGGFNVGLDIDLNPATGVDCSGGGAIFPCGSEWQVSYNATRDMANARLVDSLTGIFYATLPVAFGSDSFSVVVPLNPDPNLGLPGDGLVLFGLVAGVVDPTSMFFGPEDIAPDGADGGPLGGPSSPIPEPGAAALLGCALLVALRRRREADLRSR